MSSMSYKALLCEASPLINAHVEATMVTLGPFNFAKEMYVYVKLTVTPTVIPA